MTVTTEPETQTSEPQAAGTVRRINKTNLNYASHHLTQARVSMERALGMLDELSQNRGEVAAQVTQAFERASTADAGIYAAITGINDVQEEIKAFFGE